jgi:hypothetical protein
MLRALCFPLIILHSQSEMQVCLFPYTAAGAYNKKSLKKTHSVSFKDDSYVMHIPRGATLIHSVCRFHYALIGYQHIRDS